MGLGKLGSGEKLAGASAISLFVYMFLDWFGLKSSDNSLVLSGLDRNAWEALDYIPIALVIAIIAALGVVALRLFASAYEPPVSANAVVAILGIVSAGLIIFRIIDPPNFGSNGSPFFPATIEGTVQFPIFLALVAAAGIAVGGFLGMREDGDSSLGVHARRHRCHGRLVTEDEPK
jgi:hypothetical protein